MITANPDISKIKNENI